MAILDSFKLTGRVALVTGAARGMGQAIALGLAEAGADVAVVDVLSLEETRALVEGVGRRCLALERDLLGLRPEGAAEIVWAVVEGLGRLDILVNNAGILRRAPAVEFAAEDWERSLSINLSANFYLSQVAAARFLEAGRGGKIVNLASMLSFQGGLFVPAYTTTKSAIAGLTRSLANEWARHGINVNAIAPGYIATEMTASLRDDPVRGPAMLGRIPAGRWGDPTDVQGAVVFLCSDAAAYIHGVVLPIDGGWLAW
jgi:2-dehydro-3-deoxy-D-gluconate 5-dehydrogenase